MSRKEMVTKVMNEKLGLNYSGERYKQLADLRIIRITPIGTESVEDMAKVYKRILPKEDILKHMDSFMNYSISAFLVNLGRKKCSNVYEVGSAMLEILEPKVFSECRVESFSGYSDEPVSLYLESSNVKIGEDLVSYHRGCRCFIPSKRNSSLEEELSNVIALLNIGEDRLSCVEQDSHYSVFLDGKHIGVWSLDLMDKFYEESEDIYRAEHHDKDFCEECSSDEYCKYQDDTLNLSKTLISDELNVPIFSISNLLEALGREVVCK